MIKIMNISGNGHKDISVQEIVWREDLYPRFEPNPSIIQKYAEDIELLPPVEVNQHNELIDGYHRWTAHKKAEVEIIKAFVTETESDRHFARLAMRRNARHGFHIANQEKKAWLLKWYIGLKGDEKEELADDLAVSLRTVNRWTARKDKDLKEQRKQKAFDLWLACWTYDEVATELKNGEATIIEWINDKKSSENANWHKSRIFPDHNLDPDWTPPLYNVWKQKHKNNSTDHFGNSETSFLDNLLFMYTDPFDIVVDPFAGGGATIDVCKKRLRRYWVSDRLPIVERRDIRQHDILDGPPSLHKRWGDVALLFLDPPYWKQAEEKYSKDPQDLANMSLVDFYDNLVKFIIDCSQKMAAGSRIALMMQSTQWRAPNKEVIDHVFDIKSRLNSNLGFEMDITCPYESQQATAQQVEWAKENRTVLIINRSITVWRVS